MVDAYHQYVTDEKAIKDNVQFLTSYTHLNAENIGCAPIERILIA